MQTYELNSLTVSLQPYQTTLERRLAECSFQGIAYIEHVNALTLQKVRDLEQTVAAYQRLPLWRRLFESSQIRHQRRLLALYYEDQLLKQLRQSRSLASQASLADFSQWHHYTPTTTIWESITGWPTRLLGFSWRLRVYRKMQMSLYQNSQVALIPVPVSYRIQAQAEVDRLFNEKPGFHPYQILGLVTSQNKPDYQVSAKTIKAAYKNLIRQYHPDRQPYQLDHSGPSAEDINLAYSILSCSIKRSLWDDKFKNPSAWQEMIISLRQKEEIAEEIRDLQQELGEMKKKQEAQEKQIATLMQLFFAQQEQADKPINVQGLLQQGLFQPPTDSQVEIVPVANTNNPSPSHGETTRIIEFAEAAAIKACKSTHNA